MARAAVGRPDRERVGACRRVAGCLGPGTPANRRVTRALWSIYCSGIVDSMVVWTDRLRALTKPFLETAIEPETPPSLGDQGLLTESESAFLNSLISKGHIKSKDGERILT